MAYSESDLKKAHAHSLTTRKEIEQSKKVACFFCERIFNPKEIEEWIDDDLTAVCPYCGIDSVMGDKSGFSFDKAFLQEMHDHWFKK